MSRKTPFASSLSLVGRAFDGRALDGRGVGAGAHGGRLVRHPSSPPRSIDRGDGAEPSARVERRVRHDLALVLSASLAAALVAASLVLLAGVRIRQVEVGYRVHDLRNELVRLRHERSALEVERSALLRPSRLAELARTELGLGPVSAARALRLQLPGTGAAAELASTVPPPAGHTP